MTPPFDDAPFYYISLSDKGVIDDINAYFLRDLAYSKTEVVAKMRFEDLLTVGGKIFFQTHCYPMIKMQKKANELYLSFRANNQDEIPVLLNAQIRTEADSFQIIFTGLKISRRNLFEQELLEAKNAAQKALEENLELVETREELRAVQTKLELQLRRLSQKNAQQVELNKVLSHDLQEPLRKISLFSSLL